jgi:hypothetical protein
MSSKKKLNILWISFEDTSPFYNCYGDRAIQTPYLDKLAEEGCLWNNAFATAGVCAPARSAIITGLYPISSGALHMRTTHTNEFAPELPTPYDTLIPHYVKCFSEYLRIAGYYCSNNFKTDYQFSSPISAWDDCGQNAHWRNRPEKSQPFFAVFNLNQTHESAMWPEKTPEVDVDPNSLTVPPIYPDTPKVRMALARMYTRIQRNDRILGELLQQLEEDGLSENTVVMHWSDHGPLPRGKRWPYDLGIRVPMIIKWPNVIEPGSVSDDLISTIDLGPTVLSILDMDIPAHMQGQAFLGKNICKPRKYIYASRDRYDESYDMVRAIRSKEYKYIRNYHTEQPYFEWIPYRDKHPIMEEIWRLHLEDKLSDAQNAMFIYPRPVEELYDIINDPYEINNLAKDSKFEAIKKELILGLDSWLTSVGDYGKIDEAQMVANWYPNGVQPITSAPLFIPITAESPFREPSDGGTYTGPCKLHLYSATQGASIVYAINEEEPKNWHLYTSPISLPLGKHLLKAKAIRIGFAESKEVKANFIIKKNN